MAENTPNYRFQFASTRNKMPTAPRAKSFGYTAMIAQSFNCHMEIFMRGLSIEEELLITGGGFLASDPGGGPNGGSTYNATAWNPNWIIRYQNGHAWVEDPIVGACINITLQPVLTQTIFEQAWGQLNNWLQQNGCAVNVSVGVTTNGLTGGVELECKIVGGN
jgi:hypothetical protein